MPSVNCREMVKHRIERGHGVLEDHGDLRPANLSHFIHGQLQQILPIELNLARDLPRLLDQPHDGQRRHALAAAGLPDHAQRLALSNVKGDVVNCLDDAITCPELCMKVANRK